MVSARHKVLRDVFDKSFFGFERRFAIVSQTDAVGNSEDVGINSHSGLTKTYGSDDVGSLSPYARQSGEFVGG